MALPKGYRYFTPVPNRGRPNNTRKYRNVAGWVPAELTEFTVTGSWIGAGSLAQSCRIPPEIHDKLYVASVPRYIVSTDEQARALILKFFPDAEQVSRVDHRFVNKVEPVYRVKI